MKLEDLIYNVNSAYDFIINTDFIQKDQEVYDETEKERDEVVAQIEKLEHDKQYYFEKLCTIKDLAVHDPEKYETIIEVLDAD